MTTRRDFLKSTVATSAALAMDGVTAFAESASTETQSQSDATRLASPDASSVHTRGIGVYPGEPSADFGPVLMPDTSNAYRNLAFLRPAFHSSSYDYNLTAQLITDGIKDERLPQWVAVYDASQGPLPKTTREIVLDHTPMSTMDLQGTPAWLDIELAGGETAPEIDAIQLSVIAPDNSTAGQLRFTVLTSDDQRVWQTAGSMEAPNSVSTAGYPPNFSAPGHFFKPLIALEKPGRSRFYRIECMVRDGNHSRSEWENTWRLGEVVFLRGSARVEVGGPYNFTSAWMSAGSGEEWVYVDLGARCEIDRVKLFWIARAAEGAVQVSDDAENWRDVHSLTGATGRVDDFALSPKATCRFVRVWMTRPSSPYGYILSEMEVYGRGGLRVQPKPAPVPTSDGRMLIAGGAWRIQRASFVADAGEAVSTVGFSDGDWLVATVPGTVLTSYLNAGAVPDPNFGQNQLHISDSYFYSDFWYRTEFVAPDKTPKQLAWLNFDGMNWKAEVYLNGDKLGRVEGGFLRGRFDVTQKIKPGKVNALAVRIEKNATPGSVHQKTFETCSKNGGALGADNPTFHASVGWDWISTIRGRNIGIWGDVSLNLTEAVTLENPFVWAKLPLPDTSSADVTVQTDLVNHLPTPFRGLLRCQLGGVMIEHHVNLAAGERKTVTLDSGTHAALHLEQPRLWWPAGYGEPSLYEVTLTLRAGARTVASTSFKAGLRQMTYSEEGGALRIWVNGRRFVARGGNWGFAESMLRYRAREYDAAVRYHREMNFTMIRNWVGQVPDEAFYEACDRHGILVWQDFWLANPWDGPEPKDDALFLSNARDLLLRIRNHASVGLYCGRNEGFPPPALESGIRKALADLHPQVHYISSSADKVVSGHGPYGVKPASVYFQLADKKLHSEIGAPNIPTLDSVRRMMPERAMWPQALDWGLHDFCLQGAMNGESFRSMIENSFGGAESAEEWIRLAQFVNYDTYRAMFEAQSRYRMGVLLWMSHSCWPSFVWQTYDYYFEPTAAYFGCKKGSEPLHIQWNSLEETIEVVKYSAGKVTGLEAVAEVLNMDGRLLDRKSASLDSEEDSTATCLRMSYPEGLTPVHFLRLSLVRGNEAVSTNFYLRSLKLNDFRALRELPAAKLDVRSSAVRNGNAWELNGSVENSSAWPALMVRVKVVRDKSGDRILPVIFSDNYLALMPGERRTISAEVQEADTRGEKPLLVLG